VENAGEPVAMLMNASAAMEDHFKRMTLATACSDPART